MATSLEQNEAALHRKVGEARTLYEIGQEIIAQVALKPTLQLIVDRAHDLLRADVSMLALRQEESDTFVMQAYSGRVPEALATLRIRPGEGIGGRVVATGSPIMVADYLEEYPDSPFVGVTKQAGVRSVVAVPLKAHDVVVGILYVLSRDLHKFSQEDQQLLSALADQAAIAIENAKLYEQVRQHAEELEAKVRQRTRELEEVNLKLEEASRHKSEFLANMSHELRTPMNAIIGFTRLVHRKSADVLSPKQRENLEKVDMSANQLLGLINDILDLSKIEAGKMSVSITPFDLPSLVDTCLATVEPMLKKEAVQLVKEVPPDLPELATDEDKLKQIIINLLSNALKFTEEGEVRVSAKVEDTNVKIAVSDTGIGIPSHALEYIFDEFRQVDGSSTRKYGGTGLGLSITKKLTHLLGGTIDVSSVEGEGSTFTVTLPVERREEVPEGAAELTQEALTSAQVKGKKVLLAIDDDPNVVILLRENLEEEGYYVVGALSGEEGIRKAKEMKPFAITLDILMPHKDGWEVLNDLKVDPVTRHIPIIVLSIIDDRQLGFSLGASDYLVKPIEKDTILAALERTTGAPTNRVLVVDDEPAAVDLITQLLEDEGYQIKGVSSGEEALRALEAEAPDIILLDLLMPEMDGFEVIERIKANPGWKDIPIVVVTAKDLTDSDWQFLRQRVDKIIRKSGLDRETLVGEVQGLLREYTASRKGGSAQKEDPGR
jgi:signal transduction histidine kinase/DNA-binding response OmpR family regulator